MPACGVAGLSHVEMYRVRYRIAAQHCLQTPTTDSKDWYKVSCIISTALSTVKAKGKRRQLWLALRLHVCTASCKTSSCACLRICLPTRIACKWCWGINAVPSKRLAAG
jgi:hypothetical protein